MELFKTHMDFPSFVDTFEIGHPEIMNILLQYEVQVWISHDLKYEYEFRMNGWPFWNSDLEKWWTYVSILNNSLCDTDGIIAEPCELCVVDTNEMEDIRWFAKEFVAESLKLDGSTALTFKPSEEESQFHVPGKASLARFLIKEWVHEK